MIMTGFIPLLFIFACYCVNGNASSLDEQTVKCKGVGSLINSGESRCENYF